MGGAGDEAGLPLPGLVPGFVEGTGLVAVVPVGVGGFPDGLLLIVAGGVWEPLVEPETGALVGPMPKRRTR